MSDESRISFAADDIVDGGAADIHTVAADEAAANIIYLQSAMPHMIASHSAHGKLTAQFSSLVTVVEPTSHSHDTLVGLEILAGHLHRSILNLQRFESAYFIERTRGRDEPRAARWQGQPLASLRSVELQALDEQMRTASRMCALAELATTTS